MICEDKKRLLDAYQYLTQKHAAAVTELNQQMGTLSKADYDALYQKAEALRHDVSKAQQDYQMHISAHCC